MDENKTINDGGPAFPAYRNSTTEHLPDGRGRIISVPADHTGMTLRELYAGMAMQGFVAAAMGSAKPCDVICNGAERKGISESEYVADIAVEFADALIAALGKGGAS